MPKDLFIVAGLAALVIGALHIEWRRHRRGLARIPIRIHVNGTRGKSSVTRLIAAVLREHGIVTVAKTTGTASRFIAPDGSEEPIPRDGPPNIGELIWAMKRAGAMGAQAVVFECMAVNPDLQDVAENAIVKPTLTVITNARLDHTDVQGRTEREIAGCFPVRPGGSLVTADQVIAEVKGPGVAHRGGNVSLASTDNVRRGDGAGMKYVEHPDNLALALEVAFALGIPRETAVRGLQRSNPDPGVASVIDLGRGADAWALVNLFAANDPQSTFAALDTVEKLFPSESPPIMLFTCRGDRAARSAEFAAALAEHQHRFAEVVIWGEKTKAMVRKARAKGIPAGRVVDAGSVSPAELTDLLVRRMNGHRVVIGVGNIIGPAQEWMEYLAGCEEAAEGPPEGFAQREVRAPRELESVGV
jgi:poly-gamma-glutamate synthase PgsB/CapB